MSAVTLPTLFVPATCVFTQTTNQRVAASPFGGSEQAIDLLNDRWKCSLAFSSKASADAAWIEAFIGSMRGQTNTVALYHFARPVPRGTARGSMTLSTFASQGASSIVLTGVSPSTGTLLAGDMLGVGGLLLMVASDCTASGGVVTAPITNRLRVSQSAGAVVAWNKPATNFRMLATSDVEYVPGNTQPVTFDFGEAI